MSESYDRTGAFGPQVARRTSRNWLTGRMVFGLLLLAFGVLWTLDNLHVIDAQDVTRYWPVLLLAWGLCMLTGLLCRRRPLAGLIWALIGGWLLLYEFELVEYSIFDLWPVALIFIGAMLVLRAWRGGAFRSPDTEREPVLSAFVVMGGIERKVVSESFRGGEVNAIMGGVDVDLRSAKLAPGGAMIDVLAMFGGVDLIVPEGWRVIGHVTPLLGGFEDSTVPPADPNAPTLTVRGLAVMGGVDVKHADDATQKHARWRDRRGFHPAGESWSGSNDATREQGPSGGR